MADGPSINGTKYSQPIAGFKVSSFAQPVAFTAIFDVYTRVYRGNDK